ncbi:MAG TPA: PQQ-dependent sugar dehydrogenase [Caulobacteraceae bacterium]|jgi:glucose/arabinose dehydrogenase|nr:PQQ-dependent sugar dehydrogenase [Caulobacteraceae bacterium]
MKRLTLLLACLAAAPGHAAERPPPERPAEVPGKPIETRPPELATDRPAFPGQTRAPYRATPAPKVAVLTAQLKAPWSLAFLPGGRMLVTEKAGALRIVGPAGAVSAPIAGVPAVVDQGQVGLLDVALDRNYAGNGRIFLSYAEPAGDNFHIAVASARLDPAALALRDVKVIFRARPDLPRTRSANSGGRIAVASDGSLFVTIGDRSQSPPWDMAQKLDTHLGKIIHITPDGAPARGNPFVGKAGALPEIWSIGHRSQEGLAFDPSGRLWETEHGPRGGDELNTPEAGKNYGWPLIVHGIDYPGAQINGGLTEKAGLEQPRYYWDPVIAPSGLAFYQGSLFPQWRGSVLVGALRGQMLDRLTLAGDKVVDEEPLLFDQHSRIRDVRVGPEGAVYVLTDDGRLLRLTPG